MGAGYMRGVGVIAEVTLFDIVFLAVPCTCCSPSTGMDDFLADELWWRIHFKGVVWHWPICIVAADVCNDDVMLRVFSAVSLQSQVLHDTS